MIISPAHPTQLTNEQEIGRLQLFQELIGLSLPGGFSGENTQLHEVIHLDLFLLRKLQDRQALSFHILGIFGNAEIRHSTHVHSPYIIRGNKSAISFSFSGNQDARFLPHRGVQKPIFGP